MQRPTKEINQAIEAAQLFGEESVYEQLTEWLFYLERINAELKAEKAADLSAMRIINRKLDSIIKIMDKDEKTD